MFARLLLLFIGVPLVELVLLLYLADRFTWQATLGLVVVTGIVGAALARRQGWKTYQRLQAEVAAGRPPTESLLDAAMILVAGALLLTPGLMTDLFGFSLLWPPARRVYRRWLGAWFRKRFQVVPIGTPPGESPSAKQVPGSQVIDSYVIDSNEQDAQS